jgi:predicted nicotinamide N-methyase|tara:strand:- start:218 stop:385 length:168 start_codon:yes stop_codon:yes gene_type:complete
MDISQQREREREKTKEKNALSMLPAPPFAAFACAFSLALADFWPLPPPMVFRRKR